MSDPTAPDLSQYVEAYQAAPSDYWRIQARRDAYKHMFDMYDRAALDDPDLRHEIAEYVRAAFRAVDEESCP